MINTHIQGRLAGIRQMLVGAHVAGGPMSNATKGREREAFIDGFLNEVFPNHFRFGSGDVTDSQNRKSGQIDVVVEYPFLPSLPLVGAPNSRLYLAEGVAAAIEVKSNLANQWSEVLHTASQLSPLRRNFGATMVMGAPPLQRVPLFAVGYTGWKTIPTIQERLADGDIDGVLVIDSGLFVSRVDTFRGIIAGDAFALWGFLSCLHMAFSGLKSTSVNPITYALN